jgi:hypothetical protein
LIVLAAITFLAAAVAPETAGKALNWPIIKVETRVTQKGADHLAPCTQRSHNKSSR